MANPEWTKADRWRLLLPGGMLVAAILSAQLLLAPADWRERAVASVVAVVVAGGLWLRAVAVVWIVRLVVRRRRKLLFVMASPWVCGACLALAISNFAFGLDVGDRREQWSLAGYYNGTLRCWEASTPVADRANRAGVLTAERRWDQAAGLARSVSDDERELSRCIGGLTDDIRHDPELVSAAAEIARGHALYAAGCERWAAALAARDRDGAADATRRLAVANGVITAAHGRVTALFEARDGPGLRKRIDLVRYRRMARRFAAR